MYAMIIKAISLLHKPDSLGADRAARLRVLHDTRAIVDAAIVSSIQSLIHLGILLELA